MEKPRDQGQEAASRSPYRQLWIDLRLARDRTVLALSAGGLALLVSLLTASDDLSSTKACVGFWAGAVMFMLALFLGLGVLTLDLRYVESIWRGMPDPDVRRRSRLSKCASWLMYFCFVAGVVSTFLLAVFIATS